MQRASEGGEISHPADSPLHCLWLAGDQERDRERPRLRWQQERLRSQRQDHQEMRYTFRCDCDPDAWDQFDRSIHEGPPALVVCSMCGGEMHRDWQADSPMLDTSRCQDADNIPEQHRVQRSSSPSSPAAEEARFSKHIDARRKQLAEGGNRGSIRHEHSVPADLYHGKIRQTGDRDYWKDPGNLKRHNSCKVSK